MQFKTKISCIYSAHKPVFCNPGNPEIDTYDSKYDDDGTLLVFKSGKSNLQDYINSFADLCDINNIVARFERGDIPNFDFVKGSYLDVTGMPTSYADMVNRVKEGEDVFFGLPSDIREKFDNDPVKFFSAYGSSDFFSALGISEPDPVVPGPISKESEVNDESKSNE